MLSKAIGTTCAIDSTLYDTHHRRANMMLRCCRHQQQQQKHREFQAFPRRSADTQAEPERGYAQPSHPRSAGAHGNGIRCAGFSAAGRATPNIVVPVSLMRSNIDAGMTPTKTIEFADGIEDAIADSHLLRTTHWPNRPPWYRRLMRKKLSGSQKGKPYGQRAQAETVNSMMKRNLAICCAGESEARCKEQMAVRLRPTTSRSFGTERGGL